MLIPSIPSTPLTTISTPAASPLQPAASCTTSSARGPWALPCPIRTGPTPQVRDQPQGGAALWNSEGNTWKSEPEARSVSSEGFHEGWVRYRQNPGWAGFFWVGRILILDICDGVPGKGGLMFHTQLQTGRFLLLKPLALESETSD